MKATFKKILPLIAAVLFATSCSKDDSNESDVVVNDEQPTVVNNGQATVVSSETETNNDIVTFPFSVRVSTGKSLSKISFSGTDGTSEYAVQFDDATDLGKKLTVSAVPVDGKDYSDVTGELILGKDSKGYFFEGDISATTNASALKDGSIKLIGSFEGDEAFSGYKISTESLGALMNESDVKHKFLTKVFDFNSNEILLLDQVAYFCIEVSEPQKKFDLTIGGITETFTSTSVKKFWIAVSVGTVVQGNLISKSGKTAEAGKIYKANRTNVVDLGLSSGILWATVNCGGTNINDYGAYYNWSEAADAVTTMYGSGKGFRLPTTSELTDLVNLNPSAGAPNYTFSNAYGTIILPSAGWKNTSNEEAGQTNKVGYYWSSNEVSDDSEKAYDLCCAKATINSNEIQKHPKADYFSVRAVKVVE